MRRRNHWTPTLHQIAPTSAPSAIHPLACAVRDTPHGVGLFATRDLTRGARVLSIEGRMQKHPTRYSIQLDVDLHIECDGHFEGGEQTEAMRTRHPWRFLNHSCEPNARVQGCALYAIRAIKEGEQITFDYTTTEASMAEPFQCGCGAPSCLGLVRGFMHLTREQQRARVGRLAPHLVPPPLAGSARASG